MEKSDEPEAVEPGQSWEVDLFRPEDAPGVARLFREVYGEGYPIRVYLEPEQLIAENAAGRIISSVARTPKGDIVGHNALFNSVPCDRVYESGAGLVLEGYRGGNGIFSRLVAHGEKTAPGAFGVEAVFGESVCNHVFSQKMTARLGWRTQAIEADLMPASAYEREKSAEGRVSSLLDFKTLVSRSHSVYLPPAYETAARFIYDGLDDTRELHMAGGGLPKAASTRIAVRVFDFAGVARLTVREAGRDFTAALAREEAALRERDVVVIQVWLDLSRAWIGTAVDMLRERGYFMGGLLPRWFDSDGWLMQRIFQRPCWEGVQVHFERARTLLEMVRSDWAATGGGS